MNRKALVLASHSTRSAVENCVQEVTAVRTVDDALTELAQQPFDVLVAALGTSPETHIFAKQQKSKLLKFSCRRGIPRIIFSHTACQSESTRQLCFACGADAVVQSRQELQDALEVLLRANVQSFASEMDSNDDRSVSRTLMCPSFLERRYQREAQLKELAGGTTTYRVQALRSWTAYLEQQIVKLVPVHAPLSKNQSSSAAVLRMVHISDTHNHHRKVQVPSGDLFVHTGDFCGNYDRKTDLVSHFYDFLQWLEQEICPRFEQVVFVAGNHDTYLDPTKAMSAQVHDQAVNLLQAFLGRNANAIYLNNSWIRYRGLLIYGSPVCPCRLETKNKRYVSNGFERTQEERQRLWQQIPKDTDILLTHVPPERMEGCRLLEKAVYEQQGQSGQPRIHAHGHVHKQFGVTQKGSTLLLNGCQERILRDDIAGSPLVVTLH